MRKISTNITLDPQVKEAAVELFSTMGLDLSTAIGLFLNQAIYEHAIPFKIRRDIPNKETLAAINESKDLTKNKKIKSYSLKQALEMIHNA